MATSRRRAPPTSTTSTSWNGRSSATGGSFDYGRFLGAASPKVGSGNLLAAFEWERDNGPWVSPNNKDKFNGVVRYTQGTLATASP